MCAPPASDPVFACDAVGGFVERVPGAYVQHRVLRAELPGGAIALRGCELMCVSVRGLDGAMHPLWPGLLHLDLVPAVEGR